jgi:hypothetical protein
LLGGAFLLRAPLAFAVAHGLQEPVGLLLGHLLACA